MDSNTTSQAKAASDERFDQAWECPNDMETKLLRVKNLTEVMWMAGESLSDMTKRNAITVQCDVINEVLREALDLRADAATLLLGRSA